MLLSQLGSGSSPKAQRFWHPGFRTIPDQSAFFPYSASGSLSVLPILGSFPSLLPSPRLAPITLILEPLPCSGNLLAISKTCPGACSSSGFRLEGQAKGLSWKLSSLHLRDFPETQPQDPVSALTPRGWRYFAPWPGNIQGPCFMAKTKVLGELKRKGEKLTGIRAQNLPEG